MMSSGNELGGNMKREWTTAEIVVLFVIGVGLIVSSIFQENKRKE